MKQVFLIKLSGEAMAGEYGSGLDFNYIETICKRIKECHDLGVGIGIVCGGGNFMRCAVSESGAYLAYVSIYDASKVQNLPARTIFITKYCCCQQRTSKDYRPVERVPKSRPTPYAPGA